MAEIQKTTDDLAGRRRRSGDDRGGVTPLMAIVMILLASSFAASARLGGAAARIARADAAAEAVALTAALGGDTEAAAVANGARLVRVARRGERDDFESEVDFKGVKAKAAARSGAPLATASDGEVAGFAGSGGGGRRDGLAPETLAALARADHLLAAAGLPSPVPIVSGFRSVAEQMALWARRGSNPYPVAPPGKSAHNKGLAVDIPRSFVGPLLRVASPAGLCQPFPDRDPIHFGPAESPECGGRAAGSGAGGGAVLIDDEDN